MSPYIFAKAIHEGRTIELYHLGFVKRDYSYIDDIVAGTIAVLDKPAEASQATVSTISAPRAARTSSTSSPCSRRRWAARPRSS